MSMSGILIDEEDLPVVKEALEIARDTCPAAMGESAQEVLNYIEAEEANA